MANWANMSEPSATFGDIQSSGTKSVTTPQKILRGSRAGSYQGATPIPVAPDMTLRWNFGTLLPSDETTPVPVIAIASMVVLPLRQC